MKFREKSVKLLKNVNEAHTGNKRGYVISIFFLRKEIRPRRKISRF
jgi:hypothetical protein